MAVWCTIQPVWCAIQERTLDAAFSRAKYGNLALSNVKTDLSEASQEKISTSSGLLRAMALAAFHFSRCNGQI